MSKDFLVELGTEELPPKNLESLSQSFLKEITSGLKNQKIAFASAEVFATPRRLAVRIKAVEENTPVEDLVIWGPPAKIAFDEEGNATKAALAFANKNQIDPKDLKTENDGKVDKLVLKTQAGGEQSVLLFENIVQMALEKLPIAKRMRWGSKRREFVRPLHWLMMLFGDEIVGASVLGLQANRQTRGHRFHYDQTLDIQKASEYVDKLKNIAYVLADFDERKTLIRQQVEAEAEKHGGQAVIDIDLLNEVTALVEWPVALTGRFDERFLEVPAEALISSMKEHQKYFHMVDKDGNLLPYFTTIANLESQDPQQVIDGNERVIRPRLADAAFFFEMDKKTSLEQKRGQLKTIVFQNQLGTVFEKTERVARLASGIAEVLNLPNERVSRAGQLCKSDLVSDMVQEFSDMQGIAGYHYALNDGEENDIALAMNEHYMPRYAGDQLPSSEVGSLVALADRLDTLIGIFGIGEQPTGSKDPFALRRASVGVLRILVEQQRSLDLRQLLQLAYQQYTSLPEGEKVIENVLAYMLERFRAWYEEQSIPAAVFQAVSAKQLSQPLDIDQRVQAVNHFRQLKEAEALAGANKRVSNMLSKVEVEVPQTVTTDLLTADEEKALATAIEEKQKKVAPLFEARDYKTALAELASLQAVVDKFFDGVMVMTEDEALKNNRLALLQQLRSLFLEVADISLLAATK
jgi:glycyl-tRNA synthetase beta chain